MSTIAADFSWARPTAADLLAVDCGALIYDKSFGNQRPSEEYRSELAAAGVTTAGIHEEYGTEAFEGYMRGVNAAKRADIVFAPGVLVYYNAGDTPNVDGHEGAISDFFRGVGETTREPIVGAYGGIVALRAAQAGHPKVQRLWGVETWHPTVIQNRWHNGDPRNVALWRSEGVHLLQMVGPGPLPGTDLDLIFSPDWASLGGSTPPHLEDDMIYRLTTTIPDVAAAGSLWGYTTARWVGPLGGLSPGVSAQDIDPDAFMTVRLEQEQFRNLLAGGVSGGSNPSSFTVSSQVTSTVEPG